MNDIVLYGASLIVLVHGLIHLMGTATYLKLATINELPYKTALLDGRWEIGDSGIRVFGVVWLIATVIFIAAAYGLAAKQDWWQAAMLIAAALSLVITVLDYKVAYAGIVVNIVIVVVALINPSVLAG
jgi:hypothetical protein